MIETPVNFTPADMICPKDAMGNVLYQGKPVIEEWDVNIPKDGFIRDFCLATKGKATPSKFSAWSAMWLISSVIKRDAWLQWDPHELWGNLWVIIVAPPKWFGKSTVADDYCDEILQEFIQHIHDPLEKARKNQRLFHGSVTIEALYKRLSEEIVVPVEGADKDLKFKYSFGSLLLSEFGTFLGKARYKEDIVQRLDDLYSSKSRDEVETISRGVEILENTYITLLAATTPKALAQSMPESAQADGFMSRIIICKHSELEKSFTKPFPIIKDAISKLALKLAWIALYAKGEYVMCEEADRLYEEDFGKLVARASEDPESDEIAAESRVDNLLLKTAMIVRASRYELGNIITKEDYLAARTMVFGVYQDTHEAMQLVGSSRDDINFNRVSSYIKKKGSVERVVVQRRFSAKNGGDGIRAPKLTEIIEQLLAENDIAIYQDNKLLDRPTNHGSEIYKWIANGRMV